MTLIYELRRRREAAGESRPYYGVATICGGIGEAEAIVVRVAGSDVTSLRADYAPDGHEHPGEFPYTRGISAEPGPWIMGQYAGFGTAAETNARFRALLEAGVTGFSVALDLPTQMGLDSDDPRAAGEVGKVGVAIDSLADIETLMEGIPLERISQVRTTANSIGYIWAAMFVALAEQRGLDPNAFGMFIQNDVLKEYIARGTQIFPPEPSLRLSVDVLEYVARAHAPLGTPRRLRVPHPRVRLRRRPGDRVHVRQRDGVPRRRRGPRRLDRRGRADAVHVPVSPASSSSRRWRSSGRRAACGRSSSASGTRRTTREASSCASSSSPPARR